MKHLPGHSLVLPENTSETAVIPAKKLPAKFYRQSPDKHILFIRSGAFLYHPTKIHPESKVIHMAFAVFVAFHIKGHILLLLLYRLHICGELKGQTALGRKLTAGHLADGPGIDAVVRQNSVS